MILRKRWVCSFWFPSLGCGPGVAVGVVVLALLVVVFVLLVLPVLFGLMYLEKSALWA